MCLEHLTTKEIKTNKQQEKHYHARMEEQRVNYATHNQLVKFNMQINNILH